METTDAVNERPETEASSQSEPHEQAARPVDTGEQQSTRYYSTREEGDQNGKRLTLIEDPGLWYDARNLRLETLMEFNNTKVRNFLHKYDIL